MGEELLLPDLLPELMTMRAAAGVEVVAPDPAAWGHARHGFGWIRG